MPKYLPVTTSGPICEFLLRNNGPRIVDLTIRAPALSRMMPCRNAGSLLVFSKKSIEMSENFIAVRTRRRRSKDFDANLAAFPLDGRAERNYQPHTHAATFKEELLNQIQHCSMPTVGLSDVRLGRTLVIATDNLINRSNLYQAAFLQKDRPIAHRLN